MYEWSDNRLSRFYVNGLNGYGGVGTKYSEIENQCGDLNE